VVEAVPEGAEAERDDLGDGDAPCDFFDWVCDAATGVQDSERHRVGEAESAAELELPVFHAQHGDGAVGGEERKEQACVQLRGDAEGDGEADEDGVDDERAEERGKDAREASDTEASGARGAVLAGEHDGGGLVLDPFFGRRDDGGGGVTGGKKMRRDRVGNGVSGAGGKPLRAAIFRDSRN